MTSANVVEYRIEKDGKQIGHYRQNMMCNSRHEELLKFEPLSDHQITPYGYDEEGELWESETQNLESYMMHAAKFNKAIKEHFDQKSK